MRVAVIGGGIAGLAAAARLAEAGASVVLFEAGPEVGGKLRAAEVGGVTVDVGAEAMLARRPEGLALVRASGLGDDLIAPLTTSASVRAGGALHPLPARTMLGIPADAAAVRASGALSEHGLRRIEAEPDLPPLAPLEGDVAVGQLVRERLGNEVTDRLVEPLLGGVYAGRADDLSLAATMPALAAELARSGGSLVRAAAAVVDRGSHDPSAGPVFMSVTGGLGRVPQVLARSGRFDVRTSCTVRSIRSTVDGFVLEYGPVPAPEHVVVDAVVVATPASKAARLLRELAPTASSELVGIDAASMAIVTLAFGDAALPPGSGLLVGAREGLQVKAVTLSSQKWPLPGAPTVLRASIGRAGDATLLQREDADLVRLVRHELRDLLGLDAQPLDSLVTRWGGGLPQYAVGHVERVARIRAAVNAVPGLAVCGASYDGVGIPACIASAGLAADQVLAAARPQGQ